MYIIIVGGGQVGYQLARALLAESHEALVIEKNAVVSQAIANELGSSTVMHGDGCEVSVLNEAGTSRADMLLAVTGDDEDNLVSCQIAKHQFGVSRTLARVRNPRYEALFHQLGVDVTVSSTSLILEHIEHEVPSHPLMHLMLIRDKGLEIVEVRIPSTAGSVGKKIGDLTIPPESIITLILRQEQNPIIPNPDTIIEAGDHLLAVTPSASETELRNILTGE